MDYLSESGRSQIIYTVLPVVGEDVVLDLSLVSHIDRVAP